MDAFTDLVKDLFGPALGTGGVVGAFLYFRKYDKELREETRADNDDLRAERDALIERNRVLVAEIERLRTLLWGSNQ